MPSLEFRILNCLGSLGSPQVHLKRPLGASCGYGADPQHLSYSFLGAGHASTGFSYRAMASPAARDQFLRQMEQIVEGIKQSRMKVRWHLLCNTGFILVMEKALGNMRFFWLLSVLRKHVQCRCSGQGQLPGLHVLVVQRQLLAKPPTERLLCAKHCTKPP